MFIQLHCIWQSLLFFVLFKLRRCFRHKKYTNYAEVKPTFKHKKYIIKKTYNLFFVKKFTTWGKHLAKPKNEKKKFRR